jgi:undecaprenyl-diphosphatase
MPGEDDTVRLVQELPGWFEGMSRAIRWVTGTQVVIALTVVVAVATFLAGRRWRAGCLGVALIGLVVAQGTIKDLVDRPRPSEDYVDVKDTWTSESYPAGHAMGGTFLFGAIALQPLPAAAPRRLRTAVAVAAVAGTFVNAVANLYMGVHWPADVAGGVLFGAAFALAADAAALYASNRQTR